MNQILEGLHNMIRAIVVDDEDETRQGLLDCIPWAELGIGGVESAGSGEEAIAVCSTYYPDIIISDIRMPRLNGMAFIERVMSFLPHSKVIFISGYSDKEYLKFAIQYHAVAYFEKPLNPAKIAGTLLETVAAIHRETISYADENSTSNKPYKIEEGVLSQFESCLGSNDRDQAIRILESLLSGFQDSTYSSVNQARDIFYELAVKIHENGVKRGYEGSGAIEAAHNYIWKVISEAKTMHEIFIYVRDKTEWYFTQEETVKKYQSAYRIMRYIDMNISDKSLSVNMLSKKVHFSPAHISHMFKRKTGRTINQYITVERIEKAKIILRNRDMKLTEVAEQVGYCDANYFTRIFKKVTGVTPSEYRDKYLM